MTRTLLVLAFTWICVVRPDAGIAAPQAPSSAPQRATAESSDERVNELAAAMAGFGKRVEEYLSLRNDVSKGIPDMKETGDPAKISAREQALAQAIAKARAAAKPGDIFGPEMTVHFRRILAEDWKTRSAADRKGLFEEVPHNLQLRINQQYPTTLPLVSVPAKLLARLPKLPEELEYRLIDRHFLLRDRDANLIIDVLVNVLPARDR